MARSLLFLPSLFFISTLVSCNEPHSIYEVHVRNVERRNYFPLLPRFTNTTATSTTSSSEGGLPPVTPPVDTPTDTPPDGAPPITFPPPTAVSTSYASSVTTNTHTNIDGIDVPILHGCFFCPAGDNGLVLFGIPDTPGVYPPPPNPPFPGFPTITIGGDGNPTVDPNDESSTDNDESTESDSSTDTTSTSSSTSTTSTTSTTTSTSSRTPLPITQLNWEEWTVIDESPEGEEDAANYAESLLASLWGSEVITTTTSSSTDSTTTTSSTAPSSTTTSSTTTSSTSSTTSSTPSPTPTPDLGCRPQQDPDSGTTGAWCICDDYPSTLPLLTNTASESDFNMCGYTSLPSITTPPPITETNPFPYTFTDPFSNVIACESSKTSNAANILFTVCEGSSTTVSTGPPQETPTETPEPPPPEQSVSVQIWRWDHQLQGRQIITISSNLAVQVGADDTVDPCSGNIISSGSDEYVGSNTVSYQNDDISIHEGFDLKDGGPTGCTFSGTSGESGSLTCDNDFKVDCEMPDPGPGNICNGDWFNGCDMLTGACIPAYWLVANCKF